MNFINCTASQSGEVMKKAAVFWSENIAQHISSLQRSVSGSTALLDEYFKEQLRNFNQRLLFLNEVFKNNNFKMAHYQDFLRTNMGFINLLERIKYEAFSGYPVLSQSIFHYIYESRYVNAIFGAKNMNGNVLITTYFLPFLNNSFNCFYNQMYFWSIIGSMHPSLIMGNNAFYNAINGYAKEFLTEICNGFNAINFALSSLKKPFKKGTFRAIFEEFSHLNSEYLQFLKSIKQLSPKIFISPSVTRLPSSFYSAVDHQIAEHTLVCEINENIEKMLK